MHSRIVAFVRLDCHSLLLCGIRGCIDDQGRLIGVSLLEIDVLVYGKIFFAHSCNVFVVRYIYSSSRVFLSFPRKFDSTEIGKRLRFSTFIAL